MATYQQSITALVDGLKTLFENRTCTEAQAIANATSKPNTIYYTSDTKCVVVGGQIYGRGQQLSSVFRFIPATDTPGQGDFTDTSVIYVQPDGTNFILWWYSPSNTWVQTGSIAFDIATSAEDISYDLTPTPDLGSGDVQSAVEALDGKVADVDGRIDSEKIEFIKERFPSEASIPNLYGRSNFNGATFSNTDDNTTWTITAQSNTNYRCFWTKELVPKGTHIIFKMVSTVNTNYWRILGYSTDVRPQDYYASHSNTIVGYKVEHKIGATNNKNATYTKEFTMPEDGWLVWTNIGDTDTGSTQLHAQLYDPTLLVDLYTEYYQKGVADGSGMASIVGLGYNIYDYITGSVDLKGFQASVAYKVANPAVSGTAKAKWQNSTLAYFPKIDVSALTYTTQQSNPYIDYMFAGSALRCVPDLTFGNLRGLIAHMFDGCSYLQGVGNMEGLTGVASADYAFQNCPVLRTIGKLVLSGTTMARFFNNCPQLRRVDYLDVTGCYLRTDSYHWIYTSLTNLRYFRLIGFGSYASNTSQTFSAKVPNWGIANDEVPDARQSLIDTLITYSFDRATAGYSACTITLSANTKALLTEEEIEQITAKGYTIA